MSGYQLRDRLVSATQLTREAVEARLFRHEPLPDGFDLASASWHAENRTISYFYGRVHKNPRNFNEETISPPVQIGDWRVEFSDGHVEAMTDAEFNSKFESVTEAVHES